MFKNLVYFLLTHFSVGLILTIALVSISDIGKSFFRLNTWLSLGLIFLALLTQPFGAPQPAGIFTLALHDVRFWQQASYAGLGLSVLLLLIYNLIQPRAHRSLLWGALLFGAIGVGAYSLGTLSALPSSLLKLTLLVVNALTAAVILGSVLGAMITGHWYLVQHKLSLRPILNSSRLYLASAVARTAVVVSTLFFSWNLAHPSHSLYLLSGPGFETMVFWFRVIVGLALPLVFGLMVWHSAKIRSTQSATGILYATIVLVMIGEVSAKVLAIATGIPF